MDKIEKNLRRLWNGILQGLGVLFAWLLFAAIAQKGLLSGYLWSSIWLVGFGFLTFLIFFALAEPSRALACAIVVGFALAWLGFAQGYRLTWLLFADLVAIACAIILTCVALRFWSRRNSSTLEDSRPPFRAWPVVAGTLVAWLLMSLFDPLARRPLSVDPARFESPPGEAAHLIPHGVSWQKKSLGLALSGGGFRAAVLHAGVLHGLESLGLRPTHLSSVSGGSIVAAHYWSGGAPEDFKEAVALGRFNLRRELFLFPNALRLLWPMKVPGSELQLLPGPGFSRLDVQAASLRRLVLGGAQEAARRSPAQPRWMINATDLAFGLLIGLQEDGLLVEGQGVKEFYREGSRLHSHHPLSLARRVAISGAFPGAFPVTPLNVEIARRLNSQEAPAERLERRFVLTDGGVGDNTGFRLLRAASELACPKVGDRAADIDPAWCLHALMTSDGGAIFAVDPEVGGAAALRRVFDVAGRFAPPVGSSRHNRPDIQLSPQQSFLPIELVFKAPSFMEKKLEGGRAFHRRSFDPRALPTVILEALADLLPEAPRMNFEAELETFVAHSEFHRAHSPGETPIGRPPDEPPSQFLSVEQCRALERTQGPRGRIISSTCPAVALRLVLLDQVRKDIEIFAATPTLKDQLSRSEVEALFRLGQIQVLLQWPQLLRTLGPPG